jgi:methyl-accepting chemotaxis protein
MQYLQQLNFKAKIAFLIIPAFLGLVVLGFIRISTNMVVSSGASQINQLTLLSTYNNSVVHEMQKERGATVGFIGTKGAKFGDILKTQRRDTTTALQKRKSYLKENQDDIDNELVLSELASVNSSLSKLSSIRTQVDNLSISKDDAMKFYTSTHAQMIGITRLVAHLAMDGHVANQFLAYYSFLEGKERAGIESAVLSSAFANDGFTNQGFNRFLTVLAEQNTYLTEFDHITDEVMRNYYENAMKHDSVIYVEQKRALAISKAQDGQFGVDSTQWFEESTKRINQLKKVEDYTADHLHKLTQKLANSGSSALITTVIAGTVLLILVVGSGIVISNMITQQVVAICGTIVAVQRNNDLTLRVNVTSGDQLGDAATAINSMLGTFQDAIKEIEQSSTLLAASSEETSVTTQTNLDNLHLQQDETQLVATAVEEMAASVQEVAKNTSETANLVNGVNASVDESIVDVTRSRDEMERLSQEMGKANELIVQLQNSSSNINSVVEVIKSVADQTNLLALNAAIEAARAGDQGRGFAVVADEVRTLAKRTQDSTAEIESMVGRFQQDATSVSASIGQCSKEVDTAVGQTRKLEGKLNEIGDAASAITDMSMQVATATEEQVNVSNEMAGNINSISDLSEQNATSGSQIAAAGTEQTQLAGKLAELASRFKC